MNDPLFPEQQAYAQVQAEGQLTLREVRLFTLSAGLYTGYGMVSPYSSLVHIVHRRYSTCDKTSFQTQTNFFPHTFNDLKNESHERCKFEEEKDELTEINEAWKPTTMGFGLFGIGDVDAHGLELSDEFSSLPLVQQYVTRTWVALNNFQRCIQESSSQQLLPDPLQAPYVQPPYTLVLEIKDVLIHSDWTYETGWRTKKRPGVDLLLRECAKYFEIVVYTTEHGTTVFPLTDALDPTGYIMYRLVRDTTHFIGGHHLKNLDSLNRDLKQVVVIDWDKNSTKLHPTNSFLIPRWSGNVDDTSLYDLVSFLCVLGTSRVDDVRKVLHYYNQFQDPVAQFRENPCKLNEQIHAVELEMQ